jgi:hypothetical protein
MQGSFVTISALPPPSSSLKSSPFIPDACLSSQHYECRQIAPTAFRLASFPDLMPAHSYVLLQDTFSTQMIE